MHPDKGVDDVEEVAGVVEQQPGGGDEVVQLPEHGAAHHHDQVVQHRHVDHPQPLPQLIFLCKIFLKYF